jgi:hypothetical protein
MEKDKYYTPDITEFHIGFEFESNYTLFSKDREWTKHTLDHNDGWFWEEWYVDAMPTEFRVKHLDQEDIESLGFKKEEYSMDIDDEILCIISVIYIAYLNKDEKWCVCEMDNGDLYISGSMTDNPKIQPVRFRGKIKNKSELKRILKQIGYGE